MLPLVAFPSPLVLQAMSSMALFDEAFRTFFVFLGGPVLEGDCGGDFTALRLDPVTFFPSSFRPGSSSDSSSSTDSMSGSSRENILPRDS